jgi:hypothetical protein
MVDGKGKTPRIRIKPTKKTGTGTKKKSSKSGGKSGRGGTKSGK